MRRLTVALLALAALVSTAVAFGAFSSTTSNGGNTVTAASSFTACDYDSTILGTSGLVNYWRLGETSGTTATDSQGTSNGTYVGAPALGQTGAIAGDTNKAARFDGVNDTVDVADTTALRLNGSWSVEFWAKPISFPGSGWPGVWRKGDATTANGYELWFDRITGVFQYKRNNVTTALTGADITTGGFKHFVVTYNGTTLTAYENGTQTFSGAVSLPSNAGTAVFQLGRGQSNLGNVDLDDTAVYNTALSAATAQSHFRCGQRYRDVVLDTSGLQSYWRLREPLGAVAFDSKGSSNGTYTNGVTLGAAGALTASGDTAASLDGADDYVTMGDVYDFSGTASFSVEAWINRGTVGDGTDWRWIVGKNTVVTPREGWMVVIHQTGNDVVFERFSNDTRNAIDSTTVTAAGTWYHVVATYDGATMRLYINGVQEASASSTISMANTTLPLRIGTNTGSATNFYEGLVDEVAVYNAALSATQVKQHYDAR
jgi:hypothetical protein